MGSEANVSLPPAALLLCQLASEDIPFPMLMPLTPRPVSRKNRSEDARRSGWNDGVKTG
jgi:hypothetical protein